MINLENLNKITIKVIIHKSDFVYHETLTKKENKEWSREIVITNRTFKETQNYNEKITENDVSKYVIRVMTTILNSSAAKIQTERKRNSLTINIETVDKIY